MFIKSKYNMVILYVLKEQFYVFVIAYLKLFGTLV